MASISNVGRGRFTPSLGENGSGKSTLLGIAAGAVSADRAASGLWAELVAADPLQARQFGLAVVYQDDLLVRELSVAENLLLGAPRVRAPHGGKLDWAATAIGRLRPQHFADALLSAN